MPSRNVKARPLAWRIAQDKRVNDLQDPWAMLAYTWMIPSADNLGRMEGDPELVASMIYPRQRDKIPPARMAELLKLLHDTGLVFWYQVRGERFIQFPPDSWQVHQRMVGNMKEESDFPEPPSEAYRTWFEQVRTGSNVLQQVTNEGKGREGEEKGREGDGETAGAVVDGQAIDPRAVFALWNEICTPVLPAVQKLTDGRRQKIRSRLNGEKGRDEAWWRDYFGRFVASPFLRGEVGNRNWRADFDFAVRSEDVIARVLEGKYDGARASPPTPPPDRPAPYHRMRSPDEPHLDDPTIDYDALDNP